MITLVDIAAACITTPWDWSCSDSTTPVIGTRLIAHFLWDNGSTVYNSDATQGPMRQHVVGVNEKGKESG